MVGGRKEIYISNGKKKIEQKMVNILPTTSRFVVGHVSSSPHKGRYSRFYHITIVCWGFAEVYVKEFRIPDFSVLK